MAFMVSKKVVCVNFLVVTCLVAGAAAKGFSGSGFLRQRMSKAAIEAGGMERAVADAVKDALGLGHGLDQAQLDAKMARVSPMYETMPKNMYGRVARDAMQYIVARYFGNEHGWSIKGFEQHSMSATNSSNSHAPSLSVDVLKEKLPAYVEAVMEERLSLDGFSLGDVVTMVVVLERLIFDEGLGMLEDAYYLLEKSPSAKLGNQELMEVVYVFMLIYGFEADRTNRTDLPVTVRKVAAGYPEGWPTARFGLAETKAVLEELRRENPFADQTEHSFDVASRAVTRASENYGQWTNEEQCQALKEALVELDRDGAGRVRLVDFYQLGSVNNNWYLEETEEYLRDMGSLDVSNPGKGPQVVIANYVQAPSNCLEVSSFYSVCCLKECDGVLGMIEREIRAPLASPERLLPVVQRILDAKEEEPKNLTGRMSAQLEAVAERHGGMVPLHGRLFNQWLHYVFPHECPYPQLSHEAASNSLVSDYETRTGRATLLTETELRAYIEQNAATGGGASDGGDGGARLAEEVAGGEMEEHHRIMSQWTFDEELYVGHHHEGPRVGVRDAAWSFFGYLGYLAKLGVVLGGLFFLMPFLTTAFRNFFLERDGEMRKPTRGMVDHTVLV